MRYFTNKKDLPKDTKLEHLLSQRKAPLSEEGMKTALMDLTLYLCEKVEFLAAVYLKEDVKETPQISDIDKADMMEGTDGERYFPVFTTQERFHNFKPELKKGESAVLLTKQDLLDFLTGNEKLAAAVVNPMDDDLLLYRVQLSNMIALAKQREM